MSQNEEISKQIRELKYMNEVQASELKAIKSSLSWRATSPLRKLLLPFALSVHTINRALMLSGSLSELLRTAWLVYRALGLVRFLQAGFSYVNRIWKLGTDVPARNNYTNWFQEFSAIGAGQEKLVSAWVFENRARLPKVSVIMPVFKPDLGLLEKAIASVSSQIYDNWELCICNDGSKSEELSTFLKVFAERDSRIKVVERQDNGNISVASNDAANLATGEFLAFLDQDDELSRDALFQVGRASVENPSLVFMYSDEDKLDEESKHHSPHFKSSDAFELELSYNVYCHLMVIQKDLFLELGGFRAGFEGAQDWDLALRAMERIRSSSEFEYVHLPYILYHWRQTPTSTATSGQNKNYALSSGIAVVSEHLRRVGVNGQVEVNPLFTTSLRVTYELPSSAPSVTIIIPTRDMLEVLRPCVVSILDKTTYSNFEILIVDNGSVEEETLSFLSSLPANKVRVIRDSSPFNYSKLNNNAVHESTSDFVCFLNNDIVVLSPNWLEELISIASQKGNGAVGPMLWYPDMTVQHAGVVLGLGGEMGVAGHWQKFTKQGDVGYMARLAVRQNYSAVTAACLVLERKKFIEVGGFDAELAVAFNDVDLCLKIWEAGYRNVWTPFVELLHYESKSRGKDNTPEKLARATAEVLRMRSRWNAELIADPYYSPNLSLANEMYALSWPPRTDFNLNNLGEHS